jgi:hypothetical protein
VVPGIPEMDMEWKRLLRGLADNTLSPIDRAQARKLAKAVRQLSENPAHHSLHSHKIAPLTARYGVKVFQSYLENNAPSAGRIFWVYGPLRRFITVIGLEPHPEDAKHGAYDRVQLSDLPPLRERHLRDSEEAKVIPRVDLETGKRRGPRRKQR